MIKSLVKNTRIGLLSLSVGSLVTLNSCMDILGDGGSGGKMSLEDRVVEGLKTALVASIDSSATSAGSVGGYLTNKAIKILLPEDAVEAIELAENIGQMVEPFQSELQTMQLVSGVSSGLKSDLSSNAQASSSLIDNVAKLSHIGDSVVKYMNRGAEKAAPASINIFGDAITSMSIGDGLSILNSDNTKAATDYLNGKTFSPLTATFSPVIDSTLQLVPLMEYWGDFRDTYNSIVDTYDQLLKFQTDFNTQLQGDFLLKQLLDPVEALKPVSYSKIETESLGQWTTEKALTGLFYLVGEEETKIRQDPWSYATGMISGMAEIIEDVFGEIMDRS